MHESGHVAPNEPLTGPIREDYTDFQPMY